MNQACPAARSAIEGRRFTGWQGLPSACTPGDLFGLPPDSAWGETPLGEHFAAAQRRLLDIAGYYRPMAYARDGVVVLFDGMNPALDGGWAVLAADLGPPEAELDWVHGTVDMPGGECIYASRGITVLLNPENDFVVHVSVYAPTSVAGYVQRLRLNRLKQLNRPSPAP